MKQSLYLIDDSYFEGDSDVITFSKHIMDHCISEKATLIYDPLCCPLYKKLIHNSGELKLLILEYYSQFEKNKKAEIEWSELDRESVQYIDSIMELLYALDFKKRSVCAYGCIPLLYNNITMHLFFFVSPHFDNDIFHLISEKDFLKNYELIVKTEEMLNL